jgi:hypothetical protein
MKKTFLLAVILIVASSVSSTAFAGEGPVVPEKIERSFKENFPDVTEIIWQKKDDFCIAEFKENTIKHFAYFDADATLLGVLRYINTDYLPFKTISALKSKYGEFNTVSAVEVSLTGRETFYFINIMHKARFKTIKVYPDGGTEIVKYKF